MTIARDSYFGTEYPIFVARMRPDAHWSDMTVKQGHADYCRAYGHDASGLIVDGRCMRCGDMVADDAPSVPAVEVVATFAVCIDCMQYVAGIDARERGEDYPQAVIDAMTAPDAANWHLVNSCGDDCEGTCQTFTYAPCDTCASWLAGERHAVTALSR